jgi:hypothetical protein
MARTDTLLFRKALGFVALWCLLWAVIGYFSHRAVLPYELRAGYRESMQSCADDQLLSSPDGALTARRPGRLVMAACTENVRARYLSAEAGDQYRVSWSILAWALLPSLALLLFAGFQDDLRRHLHRGPKRR